MRRGLFVLLVFLWPLLAARGEDWPQFRGPTGQGHVRDGAIPVEWGPTRNVVWKQKVPGKGWSSPVVVAGRVYLTTAVPAGPEQSLRALCLDAVTGKVVWEKEVFLQNGATAPRIHTKNSHASPTPLVHDGRLFVHYGHQGTACLDLDGNVRWKTTELKYQPVHGNGGTPILVEGKLIFSCDGGSNPFVVALNASTGKVVWKTNRSTSAGKKFSFGTPLVIEVNGRKQVISAGSGAVCAYDPSTGKEIWRVRYEGYSVIPRPVHGHGLVFVCTGYDAPKLLAIRPTGSGDVTGTHVVWRRTQAVPHAPSPLLVGDELYTVSDRGVANCLDAKTGKVHWQERLDGDFSASPLFADGKVYFQSEEGETTVVAAEKEYRELARNRLDERTLASYAVADGALFLRTAENLYRIQAR